MMRMLSLVAASGLLFADAGGALAQRQGNDKVLVIYGNDKCPAGTICVTRSESERYRIPKAIRDTTPSPGEERWADRSRALDAVGVSAAGGTGSCTNIGGGGYSGCLRNDIQAARAARQADSEAAPRAPQ